MKAKDGMTSARFAYLKLICRYCFGVALKSFHHLMDRVRHVHTVFIPIDLAVKFINKKVYKVITTDKNVSSCKKEKKKSFNWF